MFNCSIISNLFYFKIPAQANELNGELLFGCLAGILFIIISAALSLHERCRYVVDSACLRLLANPSTIVLVQHTAPSNPAGVFQDRSILLEVSKPNLALHRQCKDRLKHRMIPVEVNQCQVVIGFSDRKYIPSLNLIDENDAPPLFCPDDDVKVCTTSRGASTQCITPEVLDLIKEEALNLASQDRAAARALAQVKLTWAPKKKKHAALSYSGNLIPFMLEKLNFEMPPACEIIDGKLIFPSVRLD